VDKEIVTALAQNGPWCLLAGIALWVLPRILKATFIHFRENKRLNAELAMMKRRFLTEAEKARLKSARRNRRIKK
jgi:hypothetical protein